MYSVVISSWNNIINSHCIAQGYNIIVIFYETFRATIKQRGTENLESYQFIKFGVYCTR